MTRGSSDAASVLATPLRSNATRTRHGVAVRARPGDAQLRRRRGGARHADDRRALPDRRRVRSRLPVRTRVRLGLEPRRVRGRRLPRRARGRSRPRSAHVGGSRLRAPAVRRVARPGGRPLTRARGLRARHRRVRRRVAAHARARGARTPGFFGAGSGRDAPGAVRPGTGGKKIFGGGFAPASGGTGAGASDGSGRERSPRSPRLSGMSPAGTPRGRHARGPRQHALGRSVFAARAAPRRIRRRRVRRVGRRRGH